MAHKIKLTLIYESEVGDDLFNALIEGPPPSNSTLFGFLEDQKYTTKLELEK